MAGVRTIAGGLFIIAGAILGGRGLAAPVPRMPPPLSQAGKAGPAEAQRILEAFRRAGIAGDYFLEFELRTRPRRGAGRTFPGRLWGRRTVLGAAHRIEFAAVGEGPVVRLLLQNGVRAGAWRWAGGPVAPLVGAEMFASVIPDVGITPFDLLMPFLYWPEAVLESLRRGALGRPANVFLFRTPPDSPAAPAGIAAARAYLDTQYNVLLKTELLDLDERVRKTFSLVSLKTIEQQALPRTIDFLDGGTRDKTRFEVRAAALDLDFLPAIFEQDGLGDAVRPPDAAELICFD